MATVSTYLNFQGATEEAFNFYKSLFGTELTSPIYRFGDMPGDGGPQLRDDDRAKIMHVELEIVGGHTIMGTDMLESLGQHTRIGNNTTIHLQLDSRGEVDRLYEGLSEGGGDTAPPQLMPWGQYWGVCLDRYGIRWMFSAE
jgi:PhnB protein